MGSRVPRGRTSQSVLAGIGPTRTATWKGNAMQNENSPKILKVTSILNTIGGVIETIGGALVIACGAFLTTIQIDKIPELADALSKANVPSDKAGILVALIGVAVFIMGIFNTVLGRQGVKAARGEGSIGTVFTMSVIALVLAVLGIGASVAAGSFGLSTLMTLILPALMVWAAADIKGSAAARASIA